MIAKDIPRRLPTTHEQADENVTRATMSVPVCARRSSPHSVGCCVKGDGASAQEARLSRNELDRPTGRDRRSCRPGQDRPQPDEVVGCRRKGENPKEPLAPNRMERLQQQGAQQLLRRNRGPAHVRVHLREPRREPLQDVVGQLADRPQRMVWAHALLRREVTLAYVMPSRRRGDRDEPFGDPVSSSKSA